MRVPEHGLGLVWFEFRSCTCAKGGSVQPFLLACSEEQGLKLSMVKHRKWSQTITR